MSSIAPSAAASEAGKTFEFGRTYVVKPKGKHQATIVWLHGLGDNGHSSCTLLETLPLPNIKWICPTAPQRPVAVFGGFPSTAWFDVNGISEDVDDVHGLEASAAYVASLLANEPSDIKLGIGGFSMGAATSLYCATCCFARGKFENGNKFSPKYKCCCWIKRTLSHKLEGVAEAFERAASLPILLCHGQGDDEVAHKFGERCHQKLTSVGFRDVTFKSYTTLGHYTIPEEMDDLCVWLSSKMGLDGK